jgi:hypothetical protein
MFKGLTVTAALLLLLSSVSFAQVLQMQNFGMGQNNGAMVLGDGAAASINASTVAVDQLAIDVGCHSAGYQSTVGSVIQGAGVAGMCGLFSVDQVAGAIGGQVQMPGTDIQDQTLLAGMDQNVTKIGGQGSALGAQTFVGIQTQLSFNPWGGSANVQGIGVSQYNAVGGGPSGGTSIGGTANISAGQS